MYLLVPFLLKKQLSTTRKSRDRNPLRGTAAQSAEKSYVLMLSTLEKIMGL
jgi:hypothetical protein